MKNHLLKQLVERIRQQDLSAFLLVFDEYKKLLSFYGNKLGYEDATADLTLFFVELIYNIDLKKFPSDDKENLHVYILASIKNKYFALSSAREKLLKFENELYEEICSVTHKFEDDICIKQGISKMTSLQKEVFFYHFVCGFSVCEIAQMLKVSRQAVNKTKNKALDVLREVVFDGK